MGFAIAAEINIKSNNKANFSNNSNKLSICIVKVWFFIRICSSNREILTFKEEILIREEIIRIIYKNNNNFKMRLYNFQNSKMIMEELVILKINNNN